MKHLAWMMVLAGVLGSAGATMAAPVPMEFAQKVALNWMAGQVAGEPQPFVEQQFSQKGADGTLYYIFNLYPDGWVMVSGEDIAYPIIGFSPTGAYDTENHPPAFDGWMAHVKQAIQAGKKARAKPSLKIRSAWEALGTAGQSRKKESRDSQVGPLLETTWNQSQYYNAFCPEDTVNTPWYAGGHAFAGCVATAMAQIMKYHAHPTQGIGAYRYQDPANKDQYGNIISGSAYGTQSADFGNTVYQWSQMPNQISEPNAEVARLIYHCGVAVEMDFGPYGSRASTQDAATALKRYFKYQKSIYRAEKADYSDTGWKALIRSELDAHRPVLYSGSGTGGHAFVCDGYQSSDHFHFNWGWGGSHDGYFYLNSLTPDDDNYSHQQLAVLAIQPAAAPDLSFPYSQGFESTAFPEEWIGMGNRVSVSTSQSHTGSRSLLLGENAIFDGTLNTAVLKINVPENGQLRFWVKRGYDPYPSDYNQHRAFIQAEFQDTVFHTFFEGNHNDSEWVQYSLDLSPWENQVLRLRFEQKNRSNRFKQWMYIDDIQITGDSPASQPEVYWDISASDERVSESVGTVSVTAKLSSTSTYSVVAPYTVGGTATPGGVDHNLADGSLTIPAGSRSASKSFAVMDDTLQEGDQTVVLTLRTPSNAVLGAPSSQTITIVDNDAGPAADGFESNNSEGAAAALALGFSNHSATLRPDNLTIHETDDLDYYRISLPAGYEYNLNARVHDAASSGDGNSYTCNVSLSYKSGSLWSSAYPTGAPGFTVTDGGTVYFKIFPGAGQTGTYGLEISIGRTELPGTPILWVNPLSRSVSADNGWVDFAVTNTGEGEMNWTASTAANWLTLSPDPENNRLSVHHLANTGSQRSADIAIRAPDADNSPQTVSITQAAGTAVLPDRYESNNQESQAATLDLSFSGNTAFFKTQQATLHEAEDSDFYRIDLAEGYDYSVSARVQDSYASDDGEAYSCDVMFSYKTGTDWFGEYDTILPQAITVSNGGSILFKVEPWFFEMIGSYALEISVTRQSISQPILSVSPTSQNIPASSGWASVAVSNTGQGSLNWHVVSNHDWLLAEADYENRQIRVYHLANIGGQRSGSLTVTASGAQNSPQTVWLVQASGILSPDGFESNDSPANAAPLLLSFSGNTAEYQTSGTNLHTESDLDYYRLDLAAGYNYLISARVHDSYDSTDGGDYSGDVKFSYDMGTGWSAMHDTEAPGISVSNGGTVWFHVQSYFEGERGSYALALSVTRYPSDITDPVLYVTPKSASLSHEFGWASFQVANLGAGTLDWSASDSGDWMDTVVYGNALYVNVHYNFGAARSGTVTISAPGALNSPQSLAIDQKAGAAIPQDGYEYNNSEADASALSLDFTGNAASRKTEGATLHDFQDTDYYRIQLADGWDYTVSARVQDRYDSNDQGNYTCDVRFDYRIGTGPWSLDSYDTEIDPLSVSGGTTVCFQVAPWSNGDAGSYALDIQVTRSQVRGDVDGNGVVTLGDAVIALQLISGIDPLTAIDGNADVNGDGRIGVAEAIYVLDLLATTP